MAQLLPGADLAGYRIISVIGRGGMGIVYLAHHTQLERQVALKVLAPELSSDLAFRARFERESRVAASLDHPNVIPIYEAGDSDGVLFIAMRYVAGPDLRILLQQSRTFEPRRALGIVAQLAGALDAAHARGLIHRDVKPGNVLVAPGLGPDGSEHVYLTDFGLTKSTSSTTGLTQIGQLLGTIDYVSPEQISGIAVDGRADIYALGCVLFELLAGNPPFRRDSDLAVMAAHIHEPPPRITAVRPDVAPGLDQVIAKAMAKRPDDRYATASDLAVAARRQIEGVTPASGRPSDATVILSSRQDAPTQILGGQSQQATGPGRGQGGSGGRSAGRSKGATYAVVAGLVVVLVTAAAGAAVLSGALSGPTPSPSNVIAVSFSPDSSAPSANALPPSETAPPLPTPSPARPSQSPSEPSSPPSLPATPEPSLSAEAVSLIATLPEQWIKNCVATNDTYTTALFTVQCAGAGTGAPDFVWYDLFDTTQAMTAAFTDVAATYHPTDCEGGDGPADYPHLLGRAEDSRVTCYPSGGMEWLMWSEPESLVIGTTRSSVLSQHELHAWWAQVPAAGLSHAEADLVSRLPVGNQALKSCQSLSPFGGAEVSVSCRANDLPMTSDAKGQIGGPGPVKLEFASFDDPLRDGAANLSALKEAFATGFAAKGAANCSADIVGTTTTTRSGVRQGEASCYYAASTDQPWLVWTEEASLILGAIAWDSHDDSHGVPELWAWFRAREPVTTR